MVETGWRGDGGRGDGGGGDGAGCGTTAGGVHGIEAAADNRFAKASLSGSGAGMCAGHRDLMPRARAIVARRLAAYSTDLEAGESDAVVRVPDQLGPTSRHHALWAFRATVLYGGGGKCAIEPRKAFDCQKVVRARLVALVVVPRGTLDVERVHV